MDTEISHVKKNSVQLKLNDHLISYSALPKDPPIGNSIWKKEEEEGRRSDGKTTSNDRPVIEYNSIQGKGQKEMEKDG